MMGQTIRANQHVFDISNEEENNTLFPKFSNKQKLALIGVIIRGL